MGCRSQAGQPPPRVLAADCIFQITALDSITVTKPQEYPDTTAMTLQFIDQGTLGLGPNECDRRIIRSHVMRGKNAGRPRQSTRKQTSIVRGKRVLTSTRIPVPAYSKPGRQLLWNDLCLTSFPQQLDCESIKLMHRWFFDISDALFPPQFCSKFDIIKSIWVNLVLADEAYFHSTLAISASYVDFFERKPGISSKTLYHISQAYALVNRKLSGPESVSDSAIAAVITLAIYQQIHRLHSIGLIHLRGLYRMIQLRGGIAKMMKENRALALKALRLDVELALETGLPTLFSSDAVIPVNGVLGDSCTIEEQLLSTTSRLSSVMLSGISFASLLNGRDREERTKLDPLSYTETLVWLLYRLVEVSPLRKPHSVSVGLDFDVAHLAMLAFMTTLLPKYGRDDSNHPAADRLESAIQDLHVASADTQDSGLSLLLWTLFIGGVSVLKGKDHRCLILETCERLKLHDWPAVRRQLCGFPWIHTLHDLPGRCLWEAAQQRSIDLPQECLQLEA